MRLLIATVSLVAMAGAAFAGEPQKSTTAQQSVVASAKAPAKMTDQQLDKVIAGADTSGVTLVINNGKDFKNFQCVASTTGGNGQGSGAATFAILACVE